MARSDRQATFPCEPRASKVGLAGSDAAFTNAVGERRGATRTHNLLLQPPALTEEQFRTLNYGFYVLDTNGKIVATERPLTVTQISSSMQRNSLRAYWYKEPRLTVICRFLYAAGCLTAHSSGGVTHYALTDLGRAARDDARSHWM